jgi:ABC-2 type transport system permease protein
MTLFFRQFWAELVKLFARKRTWMGFGAFLGLEMIIMLLLQTDKVQRFFRRDFERNGAMGGLNLLFDDYFRGLTLALLIVVFTVFLLGALFLALVGGDIVSKEVEDGTLRMTLCRPVSRGRVLAIKYLACIAYTFALVLFIAGTALLAGIAWRGVGGIFAFIPEEKLFAVFPAAEGLARFGAALLCYATALCAISSLAFMFSCFNVKPAAATVVTLTVFLADRILYLWPQFADYRGWFMSAHLASWINLFRDPIPWATMAEDYLYLLGVNATFVIVGMAVFCRRDFKS